MDGLPAGTLRLSAAHAPAYDLAVFIARTQPPTEPHIADTRRALALGKRAVFLSGSAFQARSPKNPLLFSERAELVRGALTPAENARLDVIPLPDSYNNESWKRAVRSEVRRVAYSHGMGAGAKVCLVGHTKDQSSYYLSMFPSWDFIELPNIGGISATPIREEYFSTPEWAVDQHAADLPENVRTFLLGFAHTGAYRWLADERRWYAAQRDGTRARPSEIVESAGVVVQSGHVLMVERLERPGLGLLSLPSDLLGGKTFHDRILTHLVDRLGLLVAPTRKADAARNLLEGKLQAEEIFDHPHRSDRGHVVTRAHLFALRDDHKGLPPVGRGTAAQRPVWIPLEELDPERVFEDGHHVVERMLGFVRKR